MIEWPISIFMLTLILIQEVWGAGRSFSEVSKRFWLLAIKTKTPSPAWTAVLFATLAFMCFAFWESILRFVLQAQAGLWLSLLGASLIFGVMATRASAYRRRHTLAWPMHPLEWTGVVVGFALMIHGWITVIVLGAWVYWRSLKALRTSA